MRIHNEFSVSMDLDQAWEVLTDLARVAPCMPGAHLDSVDGADYHGTVKVRLGAITAQYKGVARLTETDAAARKAVLQATGRDTKGQGNASATVTAVLSPSGSGTKVSLDTDLSLQGKVAQFGRSVMAEVSSKLLAELASRLEAEISGKAATEEADGTEAGAPPSPAAAQGRREGTAAPGPGPSQAGGEDALDLLSLSKDALLRRALATGAAAAFAVELVAKKPSVRFAVAAAGVACVVASYATARRG